MMTHYEYSKLHAPKHRPCTAHDAAIGGGCYNCGYDPEAQKRLEYLRGELRGERISYEELVELQDLVPHVDPSDVELLEAAGVPEFPEDGESGELPYGGYTAQMTDTEVKRRDNVISIVDEQHWGCQVTIPKTEKRFCCSECGRAVESAYPCTHMYVDSQKEQEG